VASVTNIRTRTTEGANRDVKSKCQDVISGKYKLMSSELNAIDPRHVYTV